MRRPAGFTLIELLVAISVMALMAVMSWRGLDAMTQAQTRLQQRADEVQTLQAGLNQWGVDLDALIQLPQTAALDWDGRALRLTRRSATSGTAADEGIVVVAWARRDVQGAGQWLRWQSLPLKTRGEVQTAWLSAAQWAQNPGDELKQREVRISPLAQWQVFYYRGDAWTNPLSSQGAGAPVANAANAANIASGTAAPAGGLLTSFGGESLIPDGVRLVLTLPPGPGLNGTLTRDWVRPTLGGGKS